MYSGNILLLLMLPIRTIILLFYPPLSPPPLLGFPKNCISFQVPIYRKRMELLYRTLFKISNINLISILLLYRHVGEPIRDVMRANCLIIMMMILYLWSSGNMIHIYDEMYEKITHHKINDQFKYVLCVLIDVIFHIVPVLIIGLPKNLSSIFISYMIIMVWFLCFERYLSEIYCETLYKKRRDIIVVTTMLVICYGVYLIIAIGGAVYQPRHVHS